MANAITKSKLPWNIILVKMIVKIRVIIRYKD